MAKNPVGSSTSAATSGIGSAVGAGVGSSFGGAGVAVASTFGVGVAADGSDGAAGEPQAAKPNAKARAGSTAHRGTALRPTFVFFVFTAAPLSSKSLSSSGRTARFISYTPILPPRLRRRPTRSG